MKTLLIWDSFGEADLGMYVIDDAPDWLPKIHHRFINGPSPEDEAEISPFLDKVNDAICGNPDHMLDKDSELAGKWVGMKVDLSEAATLDLGGPVQVVVSGFVP